MVEVVERNRDGTLRRDGQERRLSADALCIGHGLLPATEVTRLLGADHVFDAQAGGWKPVIDDQQRTSIPGLFAAGIARASRAPRLLSLRADWPD